MTEKYITNDDGTFIDESHLYTGPVVILESNNSSKNNPNYPVDQYGNFLDDGNYTGPFPMEQYNYKYDQKLYDAQEIERNNAYEKLKKKQKVTMRHAGYRIAPSVMNLDKCTP